MPVPSQEPRRGLGRCASFALPEGLLVGGVAVRETMAGERVLAFPGHGARSGRTRRPLRLLDDAARRRIEQADFDELAREGLP